MLNIISTCRDILCVDINVDKRCVDHHSTSSPLVTVRFSIEFHLVPANFYVRKGKKNENFTAWKNDSSLHAIFITSLLYQVWNQMGWLCVKQFSCSFPDLCIVILSCTLLRAYNIPKEDRVKLTLSLFLLHQVKTRKNDNCLQTSLALFSAGVISHNWLKESGLIWGTFFKTFWDFRIRRKAYVFFRIHVKFHSWNMYLWKMSSYN